MNSIHDEPRLLVVVWGARGRTNNGRRREEEKGKMNATRRNEGTAFVRIGSDGGGGGEVAQYNNMLIQMPDDARRNTHKEFKS